MDDEVEARLREALRLHAAASPAGATMLSAVRTITGRRNRRRHTAWAAALAVLFVLTAAAVPGLLRRPQPVAGPPPIVHSALIQGAPLTVEFPYSLPGATTVVAAGHPTLWDGDTQVWTSSVPPAGASPSPVPVGKKLGMVVETDRPTLYWSETPGQWLVVASAADPPASRSDLLAVADALTRGPSTGVVPFTFVLVPGGYTVDNVTASVVTFCPPGIKPSEDFIGKIAVLLNDTSTSDATPTAAGPNDQVVVVGGRKALLHKDSDGVTLSVPVRAGLTLVVQDTMAIHLGQQDLIDFAGGIGVTPAAVPGKG